MKTLEAEIATVTEQLAAMHETVRRLKAAGTEVEILAASQYLFDAMERSTPCLDAHTSN